MDSSLTYETTFQFKRANQANRIGGFIPGGVFHWLISINLLEDWVNEGGYVVDSRDQEYTLDDFVSMLKPHMQIMDTPLTLH